MWFRFKEGSARGVTLSEESIGPARHLTHYPHARQQEFAPPWVGYMLAAMLRKENITNPQGDHAINPVLPVVHFKYSI